MDILASKGIDKVIPIKSFLLPPFKRNDIDALVINKKDYRRVEKILQRKGFKKGRRFYRDRGKRFWRFPGLSDSPAIHLHKICGWAGIDYLNHKAIWRRKRKAIIQGREIYLPSHEDEFLISALHSVFENKSIKKEEFLYLVSITETKNLDWNYIKKTAQESGCLFALSVFLKTFKKARKNISPSFPIPINYREVLSSMYFRLGYDLRRLHLITFIKDLLSYILDIVLDWLRKK